MLGTGMASRYWNSKSHLHIYTDASGKKGLGGIFGDAWFSLRCPRRFRLRDIQFKEIYTVLQAIMRWDICGTATT